jgi:ribonuclease HI
MLLWVPGQSGIQGNEDADALTRKGSGNPLLGLEPAIPVSPCVGRLKMRSGW